jgi:hypothetical protein
MRASCLCIVLVVGVLAFSPSSANESRPRWIARADVGLLGLANSGANGGGGIRIPIEGTGAGLSDAGGGEIGVEVRVSRWIGLDVAFATYRPDLEIGRSTAIDAPVDYRTARVDLGTVSFGVVIMPPGWRLDRARVAVAASVVRSEISNVPETLGLSVDEPETAAGIDARAEWMFSKSGHWGIGGILGFVNLGPDYVDLETGATGSLQASGMFFRLGVRYAR